MSNDECIKIADKICDQLISFCRNSKCEKMKILEIYNQLLDDKYKDYYYTILAYIPGRLSVRGYEIVDSEYFALRRY